jgi:hypothetical protein
MTDQKNHRDVAEKAFDWALRMLEAKPEAFGSTVEELKSQVDNIAKEFMRDLEDGVRWEKLFTHFWSSNQRAKLLEKFEAFTDELSSEE